MIARLPPSPTPESLERLSAANPGWKIERDADGTTTMSPTGTVTGFQGIALTVLLAAWAQRVRGYLSDSSAGFTMPDGAVLSPDAAWTSAERWSAIPRAQRSGYVRLVPNICIEIASESDRLPDLVKKLHRFRAYGADYVVLIDPATRTTWSDGEMPPDFPTDFTTVFDAGLD
jgi:Uma2 family endonuclease